MSSPNNTTSSEHVSKARNAVLSAALTLVASAGCAGTARAGVASRSACNGGAEKRDSGESSAVSSTVFKN
jgi:hypothetical protein